MNFAQVFTLGLLSFALRWNKTLVPSGSAPPSTCHTRKTQRQEDVIPDEGLGLCLPQRQTWCCWTLDSPHPRTAALPAMLGSRRLGWDYDMAPGNWSWLAGFRYEWSFVLSLTVRPIKWSNWKQNIPLRAKGVNIHDVRICLPGKYHYTVHKGKIVYE